MLIIMLHANWAFQIKQILQTHGLSYIWLNQNANLAPFSIIKQSILDAKYSWYVEISNSQRLTAYCRFKGSLLHETYLDYISDKRFRIFCVNFEYLRIILGPKGEDMKKNLA